MCLPAVRLACSRQPDFVQVFLAFVFAVNSYLGGIAQLRGVRGCRKQWRVVVDVGDQDGNVRLVPQLLASTPVCDPHLDGVRFRAFVVQLGRVLGKHRGRAIAVVDDFKDIRSAPSVADGEPQLRVLADIAIRSCDECNLETRKDQLVYCTLLNPATHHNLWDIRHKSLEYQLQPNDPSK